MDFSKNIKGRTDRDRTAYEDTKRDMTKRVLDAYSFENTENKEPPAAQVREDISNISNLTNRYQTAISDSFVDSSEKDDYDK